MKRVIGPCWRVGLVCLALLLRAGSAMAEEDAVEERAARLQEMKRQAAEYTLTLMDERKGQLKLHDEPILRFNNPVSGVPDGIVPMWKDGERPAVFAQIFQTQDGAWIHECQSLAPAGFEMQGEGTVRWQPKEAAAEFRFLTDQPQPDDSAARRLSQMRSIAQQFTATDEFKIHFSDRETTKHNLRLLPAPVYRYDDSSRGTRDGAVFAFVQGTDPEVFLVLECRATEDVKPGWHYALAAMTCWEVNVSHAGKNVWSTPERFGKSKPHEPYHVWVHRPGGNP